MSRSRFPWALACGLATILLASAGSLSAKQVDLTGIWRQEGAQAADWDAPVQVTLPNGDKSPHGTYVSLPYLEILRTKDNSLHLHSDVGALWVELVPAGKQQNIYDLKDLTPGGKGATLGRLHAGTKDCAPRPACFQIKPASGPSGAATSEFPIPTGDTVFYLPVDPYDPTKDPKQKQTYGDNFAPLSANFGYVMQCYGINKLDVVNPQKNTGCRNRLFEEPTGESFSYRKIGLPDGANVDVPFAWSFKSDDVTTGSDKTRTIDTGRELSNSDSLDIGVKASVNLFGFDAEADVSVATSNKLDTLLKTKSVMAKAQTVTTRYAFVLNRYYTSLNPDFVSAVHNLKGKEASDNAYKTLIAEWGTHYANAVTFGARGSRTVTLDEKTIGTLREKGTNIAAGMSAKYEGTGVGVNTKVANDSLSNIESTVGVDDREFICYGGGGCTEDGVPTGNDVVPIFLDLRPLSDLLAPPFFNGDEVIFGEVRRNLSQAIKDAAYKSRNDLDQSTMTTVEVVNPTGTPLASPQLLCGDQAVTRSPGSASQVTKDYCCAPLSAAVPVVAALSLEGVADPIVRPADRPAVNEPVKLGAAVPVNLPSQDDPKPFVSGVTVDYGFYWQRDDPVQYGVYAPNIDAFCQARFGDGYSGSMTPQSATCVSGSNSQSVNLDDVCQSEFQSPYHPYWSDVENAWFCSFQMTKPVDASAWCSMVHGAGSVAKYYPYYDVDGFDESNWSCEPGGQFDENAVCGAMAGRTFKAAGPDKDDNLQCTGLFEGVHTTVAADTSVRTYPDLADYDPKKATAGTTVNVVVPLAWSGDATTTCNGVNLDLVIGLQTVPADTLIAGP